jgi:ATP-binding cassette subfamily B protein
MDSYPRSSEASKREVSAEGEASLFAIIRELWPFIWPADRRDLKLRVAAAMAVVRAADLATIVVPFTFKWATDALAGEGSAPVMPSAWLVWALAAPITLTIAYGGMRILMRCSRRRATASSPRSR